MQADYTDQNLLMNGVMLLLRLVIYRLFKLFKKIKVRMIYKSEVIRIKKYGDRYR